MSSAYWSSAWGPHISSFKGRYFEQTQGAAMGAPISPIEANLYMEEFEIRAITTAEHLPRVWKRYVDDIFVFTKTSDKEEFLEHLNSLDSHIQFTSGTSREDGSIPFLDTLVMPQPDKSLITTVYRKPTHIYTCSGRVTATWLLNIVSITPWHTEPRLSAPDCNYWKRKKTTSDKH